MCARCSHFPNCFSQERRKQKAQRLREQQDAALARDGSDDDEDVGLSRREKQKKRKAQHTSVAIEPPQPEEEERPAKKARGSICESNALAPPTLPARPLSRSAAFAFFPQLKLRRHLFLPRLRQGKDDAPQHKPVVIDDAEKVARTVFVGNLPAKTRPKRLKQIFAPCGKARPFLSLWAVFHARWHPPPPLSAASPHARSCFFLCHALAETQGQ